jgi:glycosyltransferase involved in cell wall biosynthesis
MKLALLSARSDIHTVRWVNALADRGHDVHLFTMHPGGDPLREEVEVHELRFSAPLGYFLNAWSLRRQLRRLRPDVFHAHFASGYGTLGRLSGHHPFVLSVWGRDVYEFPYRSWVHRKVLQANLRKADYVCSTSHVMAEQTRSLCPNLDEITVTPFGIDKTRFEPKPDQSSPAGVITMGTVKKLRPKYGIDVLLRAFARARDQWQRRRQVEQEGAMDTLRLLIVGKGPQRDQLEALSRRLGIREATTFTGAVPHAEVPAYLNRLDVYAAVSRSESESFGVAILEASACGRPVVVSDVGGLPEVVEHETTGLIVERENPEATAEALLSLAGDAALRAELGNAGRRHVLDHYEWESNVSLMEEEVYRRIAS